MKLIERIKNWYLEKHKILVHLYMDHMEQEECTYADGKKVKVAHTVREYVDIPIYWKGKRKNKSDLVIKLYKITAKAFNREIESGRNLGMVYMSIKGLSNQSRDRVFDCCYYDRQGDDFFVSVKDRFPVGCNLKQVEEDIAKRASKIIMDGQKEIRLEISIDSLRTYPYHNH